MPPPIDPSQTAQDKDFLAANPEEKIQYLSAQDPEFAKAERGDQMRYIQHLTGADQAASKPEEPSNYEKLTSPTDPGAEKFDKAHPILGKGVRAMSAFGGAVMGLPGSIYHAVADPLTPEEEQDFQGHMRIPGEVTAERLLGARQVVNAGKDYASGKVTPQGAMSVLPEALGQAGGTVAGAELGGRMLGAGYRNLPLGQITRTAGRVLADTDLTKPFKAASQVPEFWRESSPEAVAHRAAMRDPLRVQTQDAVAEGRAMKIPPRSLGKNAPAPTESAVPSMRASATPRMGGRYILTPEEVQRLAQIQKIAAQRASERGLQYAAGMKPSGAKVPVP